MDSQSAERKWHRTHISCSERSGNSVTERFTAAADQYMSRRMTIPTKWHLHPAKTQISLGICPVWSESSLSAWRKLGPLSYSLSAQQRLWSDWADLSLCWTCMPFCWYCHEAAHMCNCGVRFWEQGIPLKDSFQETKRTTPLHTHIHIHIHTYTHTYLCHPALFLSCQSDTGMSIFLNSIIF